jgi:hypothetical protein
VFSLLFSATFNIQILRLKEHNEPLSIAQSLQFNTIQLVWSIFKMFLATLAILICLAPHHGLAQRDTSTASTTANAAAATHSINVGAVRLINFASNRH